MPGSEIAKAIWKGSGMHYPSTLGFVNPNFHLTTPG